MLALCILMIVALPVAVWNYFRRVGELFEATDDWQ